METSGYDQLCDSFRQLTDVRFKLLALVPSISGTAIALISKDLDSFAESPLPRFIVALLGFIVIVGIVFYDQRNSQIYNALVRRGRSLESDLGIDGPFSQRPARSLRFLRAITIWHDRGLALIYGSVLGAWLFPIVCGLLWLIPNRDFMGGISVPSVAAVLAGLGGIGLILELHRLDRHASHNTISRTDTEAQVRAVLTADNYSVRNQYNALLRDDLEKIVPLLAQSLDAAAAFSAFAHGDEEREMVAWFVFSTLQGYLISLRLFLDGFLLQSGNAQRQVLENIGMALVCSKPKLGILQRFNDDRYSTTKAIQDAITNADTLGVDKPALETIKKSAKFYDQFSHASKMSIALYSNFGHNGGLDLGGMYDPAKEEQYLKEGRARLDLARILPSFIAGIRSNLGGAA